MSDKQLARIADVAQKFNVTRATIRNWMSNGTIPRSTYYKVGPSANGMYRFDLDAVVEHVLAGPAPQVELDLDTPVQPELE